MFPVSGLVFSDEAVREWESKSDSLLADELRECRHGIPAARRGDVADARDIGGRMEARQLLLGRGLRGDRDETFGAAARLQQRPEPPLGFRPIEGG
jgi:hypothetical protein